MFDNVNIDWNLFLIEGSSTDFSDDEMLEDSVMYNSGTFDRSFSDHSTKNNYKKWKSLSRSDVELYHTNDQVSRSESSSQSLTLGKRLSLPKPHEKRIILSEFLEKL